MSDLPEYVELAPHEFSANYLFDDGKHGDGLTPFFALDSVVKQHDGSTSEKFRADGERWIAKLYYQDSGVVNPGETTPQGTPFAMQDTREFRIAIKRHPDDDDAGEQKANVHVAPRWQGMKVESSEGEVSEYSVPDDIHEGINVSVKGSNIEFARYHSLMLQALVALDINPSYLASPHPYSNVQDAERYVRIDESRSGPLHARDGPIASMGHLLESDRSGYRNLVQNDDDEEGRNVPGYYHTVTLGPERVEAAFPSHSLPKEIKHYYARESEALAEDNPLAHPKLGASYEANRWDDSLGLEESDLTQLTEELEETVLAVLADAGLPVAAPDGDGVGGGPFVGDAYFSPTNSRRDRDLVSLDLTELKVQQESVVIKHVADGISPVEWESLETLVTDGGSVSPDDIAEENGRHPDSVRRALKRLPEIIEHEYGSVKLRSDHIAKHVHEAVEQARDATRRAVEATAKAKEAGERGLDESTSALMAWAARHGIDMDDTRKARLTLRMSDVDNVEARLKEAYRLWCDAGKDPQRFRSARLHLGERGYGTAWHWLR